MKAINKGIFISICIIGTGYQVNAQTVHKTENKIEAEHKIKEEPTIKSEPHIEIASPSTPQDKEITPEREPETRNADTPTNTAQKNRASENQAAPNNFKMPVFTGESKSLQGKGTDSKVSNSNSPKK